jgi:murein DD-endopeptidase MepM/ murein hydrolase activator NlpD
VVTQLEDTMSESSHFQTLSSTMTRQLDDLRSHVRNFSDSNSTLRQELDTVHTIVDGVAQERDMARREVALLEAELDKASRLTAQLEVAKGFAMSRVAEYAADAIADYEAVLEMTDISLARLLDTGDAEIGLGGPFVPLEADALLQPTVAVLNDELGELDAQVHRMWQLRDALKRLPLATPLDNYYVASLFGKRKDPFNGRWAQHNGVDLAGPKNNPIFSAAAGTVTRAGTNGRYGKVVVVDHGHGISSLYGHLNRVLVKKGDKVAYRQRVGLMGSTGRSTGTHLHYEVRIDDKPVDPMKFIKAGRYVFKEE